MARCFVLRRITSTLWIQTQELDLHTCSLSANRNWYLELIGGPVEERDAVNPT